MNYNMYLVWCGLLLCAGQLQAAEAGAAGGGTAAGLVATGLALSKQQAAIESTPIGEKLAKIQQVAKVGEKQSALAKLAAGASAKFGKAIDTLKLPLTKKEERREPGGGASVPASTQKDSVSGSKDVAPAAASTIAPKDAKPAAASTATTKPKEPAPDASVAALAKLAGGKKTAPKEPKTMQDKIDAANAAAQGGGALGAKIAAANPHVGMTHEQKKMAENAAKDSALNRMGNEIIGKDSKIAKFAKKHGIGRNDAGDVNQNSRLAKLGNKLLGPGSAAAKLQNTVMGENSALTKFAQRHGIGSDPSKVNQNSLAAKAGKALLAPDSVLARQMTAASVMGRLGSRMLREKLQYTLQEQQKKVAAFQAAGGDLSKMSPKQLAAFQESAQVVKNHFETEKQSLESQKQDLISQVKDVAKSSDKTSLEELKERLKDIGIRMKAVNKEIAKASRLVDRTGKSLKEKNAQKPDAKKQEKQRRGTLAASSSEDVVVQINPLIAARQAAQAPLTPRPPLVPRPPTTPPPARVANG
ncbi:hypothetical protein FJ365_01775 [Candidatus Dependentiae bacterium]|nr:hypothetical protein [Candidatus Dependentiae bacterium]